MTTPDWSRVATLVADGVAVTAGDKVSVFVTHSSAMEAVVAFADEAWRRGAVVQVVATDERLDAGALASATPEVLSTPLPIEVAAMEWSTVHVSFRAMASPVLEADPTRLAALRRGRGVVSSMRWEGTRWALVRVPTPQWGEAMGLDHDTLLTEWIASFDTDWGDSRRLMQTLCDDLAGARTVVIEDEWTHLELDVTGRIWVPFSGNANWPDGEIATAPVETAVSGRIRFPGRFSFGGVLIEDLELHLEDGLIVREEAATGREFVSELLDTDDGSRRIGELGIGTNPALQTMTGDLLIDEKILGTVHMAAGRAYPECGGVNRSSVHWDIVKDLRGRAGAAPGSLRVDDLWLIRDGVVQPALAAAAVRIDSGGGEEES